VEVDHFLGRFAEEQAFVAVLDQVRRGAFQVEDLTTSDYERAVDLLRTYADLKVGFVDCAVLAVTERLGEPKLATLIAALRHDAALARRVLELLPLVSFGASRRRNGLPLSRLGFEPRRAIGTVA
jgi:hypothetical protein